VDEYDLIVVMTVFQLLSSILAKGSRGWMTSIRSKSSGRGLDNIKTLFIVRQG
jgi:hypothetical protein